MYGLADIKVDKNNPYLTDIDGVLFSKDLTRIVFFPYNKPVETYVFPKALTVIGVMSFDTHGSLNKVSLPDGVIRIEDVAFGACFGMTQINIPRSVTRIDYFAFYANGTTIYGYTGSYGEEYAQRNGYAFVAIDSEPIVLPPADEFVGTPIEINPLPYQEVLLIKELIDVIAKYGLPVSFKTPSFTLTFDPKNITESAKAIDLNFVAGNVNQTLPVDTLNKISNKIPHFGEVLSDPFVLAPPTEGDWGLTADVGLPASSVNVPADKLAIYHIDGKGHIKGKVDFEADGGDILFSINGASSYVFVDISLTGELFNRGDVNGDYEIDGMDLMQIKRTNAGWEGYSFRPDLADANGDGDVDGLDIMFVKRANAGWAGYEV
jgi:hypothetical protein